MATSVGYVAWMVAAGGVMLAIWVAGPIEVTSAALGVFPATISLMATTLLSSMGR